MKNIKDAITRFFPLGLTIMILIVAALSPTFSSTYTVMLLTSILMYVIITVSWSIFSGPTGYISLASAAFFGAGIYTSALLGKTLPLPAVIILAALISFCLAFLVGGLTLRLKGMYFAMFTFGLVELMKHIILWWEINMTGTRGRFVTIVDSTAVYYILFFVFTILLLTAYMIRQSKYGLALQSIGEYEEAAAHIGINVTLLKVVTFALSSSFIGVVGAVMATRWTYIDPYIAFNPLFSFMPVVMAVFGGTGRLYGPIAGAVIFTYLEEQLMTSFPYHYMLIFGIILVIAILFLPNGLVGLVQKLQQRGSGILTGLFLKGRKKDIGGHENASS